MNKKKKTNKKAIAFSIPMLAMIVIHFTADMMNRGPEDLMKRIFANLIVTVFALVFGEVYGAFTFFASAYTDHLAAYISTILMSAGSILASSIAYKFAVADNHACLWMTVTFIVIDSLIILYAAIMAVKKLIEYSKYKKQVKEEYKDR